MKIQPLESFLDDTKCKVQACSTCFINGKQPKLYMKYTSSLASLEGNSTTSSSIVNATYSQNAPNTIG
jgi:hypothetical protein